MEKGLRNVNVFNRVAATERRVSFDRLSGIMSPKKRQMVWRHLGPVAGAPIDVSRTTTFGREERAAARSRASVRVNAS